MTKPTIVLLHGVGLDHTMWEPVAELLADALRRGGSRPAGARLTAGRRPPG